MQQLQRLRAAAASAQAKALASLLVAGVGFHNAAMEPADRALVEDLFKANDLAVGACCLSTVSADIASRMFNPLLAWLLGTESGL
jgi:ATP-dependent DNA helicase HFM1/MER3